MSEPDVDALQARLADVRAEVGKRIVGQAEVIERLIVCLLADGNALLESNPGLGKTTMVRTLAAVTDLEFSRIQNTPDLMPSDITGTEIIRETGGNREFIFERGPVFANVVLADEINRATPKTQAALLEAMQEHQVTVAGETHALPSPFFLLATQNPIDQEGSLHPDEMLYYDGSLCTAREALTHAKESGELVHAGEQTKVYDVGGSTQSLHGDGTIDETDCLVYETDYDGAIYTIESKTGRRIRVSDNHPFLVNRAGRMTWVQARDLSPGDRLVSPRRLRIPAEPFISHAETFDLLEFRDDFTVLRSGWIRKLLGALRDGSPLGPEEIDALRIAAGFSKRRLAQSVEASYDQVLGFLSGTENGVGPQLRTALRDSDIQAGDFIECWSSHRIDDSLSMADAGFFIGFILAEGHVTEKTIQVSQKNRPELLDRWIDIAEGIGVDISRREQQGVRYVQVCSKPLVAYLTERFHLDKPQQLVSAPMEFREELLEVFILTESHFDADNRRITFTQKDRMLTNLVAHLLLQHDIIPWVYSESTKHRIKIQGEDLARYLELFSWPGEPPSVERFKSVHRTTPISSRDVSRVVDHLGMKFEEPLSSRPWYNSTRMLHSRQDFMATDSARSLLQDIERTLALRRSIDISATAENDLGAAAKYCGLSITELVQMTSVSKHRIWKAYQGEKAPPSVLECVVDEFDYRIGEAEAIAAEFRGLLEGDVFYDPIESIEVERYTGPVIGLSVPRHHNYVAGLSGCGISHNTFPLPEAQTDRFLLKLLLDYPTEDEERDIVDLYTEGRPTPAVERVLTRGEIEGAQALARQVPIADDVRNRAIRLVRATREAEDVDFGASPRASMGLVLTAKARAFLRGRNHVTWEDVELMAPPVLRHRIMLDFRAEREGRTADDVIAALLAEA